MHPPRQRSRINLAEIKERIVRELGPQRSKHYFFYLTRLLSLRLSKVEFQKLCLLVVGRENVSLHNQFIRSILKNACCAKFPPLTPDNQCLKTCIEVGENQTSDDNPLQNGYYVSVAVASTSPGVCNGNILPVSPRKARTHLRDRRGGEQPSALGHNGKNHSASTQLTTTHSGSVILDNGALTPMDTQCPMQHLPFLSHQPEKENEVPTQNSERFSIPMVSPRCPVSVHSEDQSELSAGGYWGGICSRRPLQAPFGVLFCQVTLRGAWRALPLSTSGECLSASSFGGLFDSITLRERMKQTPVTQGLERVSIESANMLNNGLDSYLKRIIGSCIRLVGAKFSHETLNNSTDKQHPSTKLINGVRIGHQLPISGGPSDVMHGHTPTCPISLQDFRSAMELNPQQLGEDWPLMIEKICIRSFDE